MRRRFSGQRKDCQRETKENRGGVEKNPKYEALNPKQIQNTNAPMFKTMLTKTKKYKNFGHWNLENLILFRISILGFGICGDSKLDIRFST
jgi:hypothetical protein